MSPRSAAIVGAGVMGLAAAWALARGGVRVTVLDQGDIPNPNGSSSDDHRLIRAAYGAATGYMRLAREAHAAWAALEREAGEALFAPTGVLALAAPGDRWARSSAEALSAAGIGVQEIPPARLAARFPLLSGAGLDSVFLFEEGGVLFARRILHALVRRIEALGGTLRAQCPAAAVDPDKGRVLLAEGGAMEADFVVVAAGAWAPRLLPALAGRIAPSRQPVLYLRPPPEKAAAWARMPAVLEIDPEAGFYLMPPAGGTRLKAGTHRFTRSGDPDDDRTAATAEIAPVLDACRVRLCGFEEYVPERAGACYYAVERNERLVVEPLGPRGWVIAACSGHGFKFAPLLALELAEVLAGKRDGRALTARAAGLT